MCDVGTALAIAGTALGLNETRRAARRQEKATNAAAKQQRKQIEEQASDDVNERFRRAQRERARIRALSAESGLSGITINTVLDDVDFQSGMDTSKIKRNKRNNLASSRNEQQSRLNAIQQPDYLGAGLQIAGALDDGGYIGGKKKPSRP